MKQTETGFALLKRYKGNQLQQFAAYMLEFQEQFLGSMKISSRGWAYILEGQRLINKDQFDKVEELINNCRRKGHLPIDFVAEEIAREFKGIETPNDESIMDSFENWINTALNCHRYYTPDWWEGEKYYIQMIVEKVDMVSIFESVCRKYHIPIANSRGWSSMLQRASYAKRYAQAEEMGLQPVLLIAGDFDPDGQRITDFSRKNLEDLSDVVWEDGTMGYDPATLIIERFGLNHDFIVENNLTWIDNLITGSGKNLADSKHKNHKLPYVQNYLKKYGARKVEANAIVTAMEAGQVLVENAIQKYLGVDASQRFQAKRDKVKQEFDEFMTKHKLDKTFANVLKVIRENK